MPKDEPLEAIPLEVLPRNGKGKIRELRIDWGFIDGDDGKDYFLYCKSMARDSVSFRHLRVGDFVEYHKTFPAKGPRAENCCKIEFSKIESGKVESTKLSSLKTK